jgi:hypothetical protein
VNYRKTSGRVKSLEERFVAAHKIAEGIAAGLTFNDACRCAATAPYTVYKWKKMEEDGEAGMEGFWEIIANAKHMQQIELVSRIMASSRNDWRAAAWMLERRHSSVFGRKVEVQADLRHSVTQMSEEDLVLRLIAIEDGVDIEIVDERGDALLAAANSTGVDEAAEE